MSWGTTIFLVLSLVAGLAHGDEEKTYTLKQYSEVHGKGLVRDQGKYDAFNKSIKKKFIVAKDAVLKGNFDLSPIASPPENQGTHGTCWDYAITKALRSEYRIAGIDPGQLSFNYLICGGHTQYSCDSGGDFDAMQQDLNGKGHWLSANDPYPNCSGVCATAPMVATAESVVTVGTGARPTFKELAAANSADKGHVLVIDVAVCGSWESYFSGIFSANQCGASSINHMINMVGYNCETSVDSAGNCVFNTAGQPVNGDGYLKVMNNWGTTWGENGYMRTRYGVDAIANDAKYFTIKQPAIDGGWSDYGAFSECMNSQQTHSRTCTNPAPSNGGKDCVGFPSETVSCTVPSPAGGSFPWVAIGFGALGLLVVILVVLLVRK